MIDRRKTV